MTKYIVSGYIGFDNFGDEAIASILIKQLKEKDAEKVTLISSNPSKTSKLYDVSSCGRFNFLPELLKSDVLISGGGSLLQDVTSFKSLMYYLIIIYTALIFGKKVIIFSQGIGPINSKLGQFLTKIALGLASEVTVRDGKSQALLNKWGIKSTLVLDPVLTLDFENKHNIGTVGIQLRDFETLSEVFIDNLAKKVSDEFKDKEIKIFSLQDSIDLSVCFKFKSCLGKYGINNSKIISGLSVNDTYEEISNLEYLVSMRFHSLVVGVKSGVKTLGINYDPKIKNLSEEYHFPIIELSQTNFDNEFSTLKNSK